MKIELQEIDGWKLLDANDLPILEKYNSTRHGKPSEINKNLFPEPFIGDVNAPKVLFLAMNPGYRGEKKVKGEESKGEEYWHKDERFVQLIQNCYAEIPSEYPYYYMNPDKYFDLTPGHLWCKRVYKELINEIGVEDLSKRMACIQLHGYHSNGYNNFSQTLPSQSKIIEEIKRLMGYKTLLIIRSHKKWYNLIKELKSYDNKNKILMTNRNIALTRGNMSTEDYNKIINALK